MNVDLEAIAQRGRCDVSSLRIALPLLEQGYSPPFLARYRRDELSGLDEASLWALSAAVQSEQAIARRCEELSAIWEKTPLRDPAIGHAIRKSHSTRMLERLGRRLKSETGEQIGDSVRLAVRVLNPQKGDGSNFVEIAAKVEGIQNPENAVAGLDDALAKRLAGDPRIISAAVRWLVKNARIHIANIHDPHLNSEEPKPTADQPAGKKGDAKAPPAAKPAEPDSATPPSPPAASDEVAANPANPTATPTGDEAPPATVAALETATTEASQPEALKPETSAPKLEEPATTAVDGESKPEASDGTPASNAATESTAAAAEPTAAATDTPTADSNPVADSASTEAAADAVTAQPSADNAAKGPTAAASTPKASKSSKGSKSKEASPAKGAKKQKKVSPRQRRRRWLVSVLKPLEGKRAASNKLSSFQIVMLGRALRSQVAQCSFEYDATKLVAELQRTAGGLNRHVEDKLREIVLKHEADIREAAEGAWWDELQERASSRLVGIAAEHLRRQTDRGGVQAKVVMSIDAVGPRTAAMTIVAADGRLLHSEDLPCQLSAAPRSQAVARMGELIHAHHVDLIVVSNGPARRACMVAIGDLITQSPEKSLRWTLADRSGADAYAGSPVADQEMKATPRRFRAAAWLAFSVLQPAQALVKVDPLKLRLGSFQRELSEEALLGTLEDVMISGAARGGVDVNAAPVSWLARLPGVSRQVAQAIDEARRASPIAARTAILELDEWDSVVGGRQAMPFLRVFGSSEVLDGTLIHPDDYPLAKKLASVLEIELPPPAPPGYVPPVLEKEKEEPPAETRPAVEVVTPKETDASSFVVEPEQPVTDNAESESSAATDASSLESSTPSESSAKEGDSPAASDEANPDVSTDSPPSAADDSNSGDPDPQAQSAESSGAVASDEQTQTESPPAVDSSNDQGDESSAEEPGEKKAEPTAVEIAPPVRRPLPDEAKIKKCIKEWQVGSHRVNQLVHWLCDPFGDNDVSGSPPAVLSSMPSLATLKQGDQVIGVIVGVMPFGVFVELAPDCSGLIHVSKVSDGFVEDLHEAVQVGDVVTAWVSGVDEKRRRVALSAVSPQREIELQQARNQRDNPRGDARGGRPPRGAASRSGSAPARQNQGGRSTDQSRAKTGSGPPRGGSGGNRGGGGRSDSRGGRGRDNRGGRGRERKPESYRVTSKEPAKPISDAMQKGEEPLRSFGDLLQFMSKEEKASKEAAQSKSAKSSTPNSPEPKPESEVKAAAVTEDGGKPDSPAPESTGTPSPPVDQSAPTQVASSDDNAVAEKPADEGNLPKASSEPPTPSDAPTS